LFAQSAGQNPVDISNVFRVEYDDNVFSSNSDSATGKVDSMKLVESIEFLFDTEKGPTYFGIVYAPSVVYFEDRPNDDTDVNHLLDASVIHKFSPTRVLQVKETLRRSDEPELIEDDVTIRKNNDFFYNSFNASYTTEVMPEKMSLRVDGRYVLLRYDEGDVARASDYDQLTGGVDASYELDPNTSAGGQVRYSVLDYENGLRDSDSVQVGGTVSKIFGPSLQGNARAGYEFRDASNAVETSSDSPYLDGSLVYLPGKNTQLTVGAGYSLDKSPVNTFTQQERFRVYANANYSISPALRLNLSGSISEGSFDASDATTLFDPQVDTDGDESVIQTTVGLTYRVNVRNSLLATYQYTDLDSDVRPGSTFTRNRISLGWQYNL
jgi:hypothetical protein